jgi:hypothetical protein
MDDDGNDVVDSNCIISTLKTQHALVAVTCNQLILNPERQENMALKQQLQSLMTMPRKKAAPVKDAPMFGINFGILLFQFGTAFY